MANGSGNSEGRLSSGRQGLESFGASRFARNLGVFWGRYKWFLLFFGLGVLADCLSTSYFLLTDKHYQVEEVHAGVDLAIRCLGPLGGVALAFVGKLAGGVFVGVYLGRWSPYVLSTAAVLSFWAAWYNVWGCHTDYYPMLLRLLS